MGDSLTLLLLGPPELAVGGRPVRIRAAKTRALLCYLAATPGPRPRSELAALLWGERPDANARGSLRLALSELRKEVGGWLDITREHVRFHAGDGCFVDHGRMAQTPTVAEALRLWRGDFMDGVWFCDAPAFGGWLESERGRTRLLLRELLLRAGSAPPDQLVRLARLVAGLDQYDEEAHRLLITALARGGNRGAALACYDDLRRRLADELGVEPAPETAAVLRQLVTPALAPETAAIGRQAATPERAPEGTAVGRRFRAAPPVPRTDLFGREAEIRELRALLARERLVTLLGPGGVGKTRLAIAVATSSSAFVSFAGVAPEAAVTTLARRLGVDLSPQRPALDLLLAALSGREQLLVLDNLEHLPAIDPVIARIMRTAPGVRILATSRRRLDVPGQVTFEVAGLPGPEAEALFASRAVRAQPAFDPGPHAVRVAAICAAVGGLPLAIELAAGLLRAVPLVELAQHLGVDAGLLSADGPAVRSRHACMRTVFETSWRLLDPAGREALAALSVFSGGCTLRAALEVAGTTPHVLVHLVDHSMIQLTPSGRYVLHPLIRQFAAGHLDPRERRAVRERHAAHYTRLLDRYAAALQDASDAEVTRVLGVEMDNIRLAWEASGRPGFLDRYWLLCLRLRLYEESGAVVLRHLARTREAPYLRGRWLRMAGVSEHQLAREGESTRLARAALDTMGEPLPTSRPGLAAAILTAAARRPLHGLLHGPLRRLLPWALPVRRSGASAQVEVAQALSFLARLAYHQQDLPTMLAASLRQLNAADRTPDAALRAEAYANFATIARLAGRHRLATRYGALADRSLSTIDHPTEPASRARLARGLDLLAAGDFEAARASFAECRARTVDPRVAENCAGMLAETALWRGDFEQAAELFADTAEQAARRVGGDDIGRHWCLIGQVEALLRLDGTSAERIGRVLAAARASTDRRRSHEQRFGLRDGTVMPVIQEMRLLTAAARLGRIDPGHALTTALELAARLPAGQRGMLECWSGLAELLVSLPPDAATARRLDRHLARFQSHHPGAAARIGWARALVLAHGGRRKAAGKAAEEAMRAAERFCAPYDHRRAKELTERSAGVGIRSSGRETGRPIPSGVAVGRGFGEGAGGRGEGGGSGRVLG
ncbi:BTAD domain-containing putative transcriptional regulator [Nonomuraea jabiensis]|uniref:ATP-binding protein n=1 Tax=Nonomuraea jabiensis TaxID=882448 RepID=UPI0034447581